MSLSESVVVYCISLKKAGTKAQVDLDDVTVRARDGNGSGEAEKDSLALHKTLIKSATFKEISRIDSAIRSHVKSAALISLGAARHVVPLARVDALDAYVTQQSEERSRLVDKIVAEYPEILADARDRLQEMHDESEFLTATQFRRKFGLDVKIEAFAAPGEGLRGNLSRALYERELAKAQERANALASEITDAVRLTFYEVVNSITESLAPNAKTGAKRMLAGSVEKLTAFVQEFAALNVTRDASLEKFVGVARDLVAGVSVDRLRASPKARDAVRANLESLRAGLDALTSADGTTLRMSFLAQEDADVTSEPVSEATRRENAARDGAKVAGERLSRVEESGEGTKVQPLASASSGSRLGGIDLEDNTEVQPLATDASARFANIE